MKWYTALSSYSSQDYINMLDIAVLSCIKNTPFKPYIICDKMIPALEKLKNKFSSLNIIIHEGKVFNSFINEFKNNNKLANQLGTAGTYLRAEVPLVEKEDPFVLYTDADVLFFNPRNGPKEIPRPKYFAAAPEFDINNWSYFNAGCMIINVESMRGEYDVFYNFVQDKFRQLINHAHDQGAYNYLYRDQWNRLPLEYNWKPGWGINPSAVVIHFHGPKPKDIEAYFNNTLNQVNIDVPVDGLNLYKQMIEKNLNSNKHYLNLYNEYKTTNS